MRTLADARCTLLSRLIDHAPLLPDALVGVARAAVSEHSFVLARFVCPASRRGPLGML
jgi:hypothetical protein